MSEHPAPVTEAGAAEMINALRAVATVARSVAIEDVEAFVAQGQREQTLMPFVDPTAFMRHGRRVDFWIRAAEAFLAYRRACEELQAEEEARGG